MNDEIKEFKVDMVIYSESNQYTVEEVSNMFIDWIESKGMYCGGSIEKLV